MMNSVFRRYVSSETPKLTPVVLDLRVGKIVDCRKHENADSLYISQIQTVSKGEKIPIETVQICSGLVKYIPLVDMLGQRVVYLSNVKSSKMRGIVSEAFLLAAERKEEQESVAVELVKPPAEAEIGERLFFEKYALNNTPSKVKPKAWASIQQRLRTNSNGEVVFVSEEGEHKLIRNMGSNAAYTDSVKNATVR